MSESYKLQFTYCLLTYKDHLDKVVYEDWLRSTISKVDKVYIAHETGDENNPYLHTHVVFSLLKRCCIRSCNKFDYEDRHPNIKCLAGKKAYLDAIKYISKEDKLVILADSDMYSFSRLVWECPSLEVALDTYVKVPSDVSGVIALYKHKPIEVPYKDIVLRSWQSSMYRVMEGMNTDRNVLWLYSRKGNVGKTTYLKYMLSNHPKDVVAISDCSDMRDISFILRSSLQQGNSLRYVIFDLSRSFTIDYKLYGCIEKIKDGIITSSKYTSDTLLFRNMCLLVMSNYMPDIHALSHDRWNIYNIEPGMEDIVPIDVSQNKFAPC